MKLYYYQAVKKIEPTELLNLLNDKILFEKNDCMRVYEIAGVVYINTSRKDIMNEIENLYPNIFRSIEVPLQTKGYTLFTIGVKS
ncbi:MAG TPA: hypothetical protein VN698_13795 [Bacteroidia bacterium]|nr:hypothetical protein [Bacteroidia bacterium]